MIEIDVPELELNKKYTDYYKKYDNFDAINIDDYRDIPSDYTELMGVPITFLHKYNPDQFEIVKFRKGDDGKDLCINGKCPYFRILIRNKRMFRHKNAAFPNVFETAMNAILR